MKKVKKTMVAISLGFAFSSLTAVAGGVGNGGVSVVCRNQAQTITSAQALDIYEGEVRFGRKYDNVLDADTKVELAHLKLAKYPSFLEEFQEELAKVRAIMTFIPKGNRLVLTNDAFPKIVKVGCDFEQLANYTDEGELLVSQEIYDELDEVNKAGLLIHETVYAIFRKHNDVKDSQVSRKLTAQLLAKNTDQKVIGAIIEELFGKRVCGNKGSVDERIKNCEETKGNFSLVARTKEGMEVYKDSISGLLWSDRLPLTMTHGWAVYACSASLAEIGGLAWRLPSIEEYDQADDTGIRAALPNMDYVFWSSSVHHDYSDVAWLFKGYSGYAAFGDRSSDYDEYSVRCVAR